jgi:hypothetical protein
MIKKIVCSKCKKAIIAYATGKNLVEIKRKDQKFVIIGKDFNILSSCPYDECEGKTAISVENSKLQENNLIILKGDEDGKKQIQENDPESRNNTEQVKSENDGKQPEDRGDERRSENDTNNNSESDREKSTDRKENDKERNNLSGERISRKDDDRTDKSKNSYITA